MRKKQPRIKIPRLRIFWLSFIISLFVWIIFAGMTIATTETWRVQDAFSVKKSAVPVPSDNQLPGQQTVLEIVTFCKQHSAFVPAPLRLILELFSQHK